MKIVTIHQPDFLPWLGFFDRWQKSDLYIVLDDVQFLRRGWHHRDKIKSRDGAQWLTVPVLRKGRYHQPIKDVRIDNSFNWRQKHLRTIERNYRKAPHFEECFYTLVSIYEKKHRFLIDLNLELLHWAAGKLKIRTPTILASDYPVSTNGNRRLMDLVIVVKGTDYLTGLGSRDYLLETLFHDETIGVIWQDFEHPVYRQLHGDFIPNLSCIDYLMMNEPE